MKGFRMGVIIHVKLELESISGYSMMMIEELNLRMKKGIMILLGVRVYI